MNIGQLSALIPLLVALAAGNAVAETSTLKGRVKGYSFIDYPIRAAAGQQLQLVLQGSNAMNYFNVLPPESQDAAMFIGSTSGNTFEGRLPDDGTYTVRVYLMRASARRNEHSDFTLSVQVTGDALPPVAPKVDAVLPGTRFHASTTVPCTPAFTQVRQCGAWVVRRGYDGTATVELRWDTEGGTQAKRRILFVKGQPIAADVPWPMTSTRDARGWKVRFGESEHFEIPEPLVFGG